MGLSLANSDFLLYSIGKTSRPKGSVPLNMAPILAPLAPIMAPEYREGYYSPHGIVLDLCPILPYSNRIKCGTGQDFQGAIDQISVVKDSLTTAADGKIYSVKHYKLDLNISEEKRL